MVDFDAVDKDSNGAVTRAEWDVLELDDRKKRLDDEDSKRDMQRSVVKFCLAGMLLYPFSIIVSTHSR